jgi:hypothetical protein
LFGPKGGNLPKHIQESSLGKAQLVGTKVAYFANQIGSLQQVTDVTRQVAMVNWKKKSVDYIKSGKLESLIEVMSRPEVKAKMERLEFEATTDRSRQAELVKYFKRIARESGFGGSYEDAMMFFKYGLTDPEIITALRAAFDELDIKNGRFDFRDLNKLYLEQRTGKVITLPDTNPDVLYDAIGRLRYMTEQMTITRDISEPQGMSIQTGKQSRTDLGRLFNKLFSWVQSFQSNVITSYGDRSTLSFLVGSLAAFGVMNLVTLTLREWIRGRDVEDILAEAEDDPIRFIASAAASLPIMGRFNFLIEGLMSGLSILFGSEGNAVYPPMGSPGIGSISSAYRDVKAAGSETLDLITGQSKTPTEKIAAKYLRASQLDSFANNSPLAIPGRLMEELELIDERGKLKDYLDAIKRDGNKSSKGSLRARNIQRGELKLPRSGSIKEELRKQEQLRQAENAFRTTPSRRPIDVAEERAQEFRQSQGQAPSRPSTPKLTPKPVEPKQTLSGPSRASQKVADILEQDEE